MNRTKSLDSKFIPPFGFFLGGMASLSKTIKTIVLDKRFLILTFLWKLKFQNHDMFASQGKIYRMPLG